MAERFIESMYSAISGATGEVNLCANTNRKLHRRIFLYEHSFLRKSGLKTSGTRALR